MDRNIDYARLDHIRRENKVPHRVLMRDITIHPHRENVFRSLLNYSRCVLHFSGDVEDVEEKCNLFDND